MNTAEGKSTRIEKVGVSTESKPFSRLVILEIASVVAAMAAMIWLGWFLLRPDEWEMAKNNGYAGHQQAELVTRLGKPDTNPMIPDWDLTWSKAVWLDLDLVVAVRFDDSGSAVQESELYGYNSDVPGSPDIYEW